MFHFSNENDDLEFIYFLFEKQVFFHSFLLQYCHIFLDVYCYDYLEENNFSGIVLEEVSFWQYFYAKMK